METIRGTTGWRLKDDGIVQLLGTFSWPVDIHYNKKPAPIASAAADDTELELDEDVARLEPLLNAAWSTKQADPSLSDDLQSQFDTIAGTILNDAPSRGNRVRSKYSFTAGW